MAATPKKFHLILCGGSGPRLWPLSRADYPKQFLKIFSPNSLLQTTYSRSLKLTFSTNIFLLSNRKYLSLIKKNLSNSPPDNHLLTEPQKKNTLMAIIYFVSKIAVKYPGAIVSVFPSDHLISDIKQFKSDVALTQQIAHTQNQIVTIGITPHQSNPSYGYILSKPSGENFQHVSRFVEKPDSATASRLIRSGAFWNSGIYTFKVSSFISELAGCNPTYYRLFQSLIRDSSPKNISRVFQDSPNLSIDHGLSEYSKNMAVIPAHFSWSDIGDWKSVYQHLPKNTLGFTSLSKNTKYVSINSSNSLISSNPNKLIGLVGVRNLAIIDTPDALLVCNIANNNSFNVRDLVGKIVADKTTARYFLKHEK